MKLEVTACDIDEKFPATTYTITASDGRSVSKDLCAEHAEALEEWLSGGNEPGREAGRAREDRPAPAPAPKPAQKVAAKKAATPKKTVPARRRPKIMSLEEIEASKKA